MNGRGVSLLRSKIVRIAFATALPWACSGPDFTEIAQPSVAAIDAGSDVDDTPIILPPGTTTVQSAVDAGDATVDAEAAGSAAPISETTRRWIEAPTRRSMARLHRVHDFL